MIQPQPEQEIRKRFFRKFFTGSKGSSFQPPPKSEEEKYEQKIIGALGQQTPQNTKVSQESIGSTVQKDKAQFNGETKLQQSADGLDALKNKLPDLPIEGITSQRILDILDLYHTRREEGVEKTPAILREVHEQIVTALAESPPPKEEASRIRLNILAPLAREIALMEKKEQDHIRDERERHEEAMRTREWYDPRVGFLYGIYVEDRLARDSDLFADRNLRDFVFDRIFALADAQPDQQFNVAFDTLYDQQKYKGFIDLLLKASQDARYITNEAVEKYEKLNDVKGVSRDEIVKRIQTELKSDLERYKLERRVREIVHNANYVLDVANIKTDQLYGFIDGFSSELIDYVWRMPGVRDMMNIYENELRKAMWERDGYLDPEDVKRHVRTRVGEDGASRRNEVVTPPIEERAKKLFREYVRKHGIYVRSDDPNKRSWVEKRHQLEDWEVDRIFTTARGMMVLSMRMVSLAAESKIPPEGRYTSLYLQDILQSYAPYTHLLMKFNVPSYKSLAMLLSEPDREKFFFGKIRKPWMAKKLIHVAHVLSSGNEGMRKILDGRFGELLQIRRLNPAMCGDAFGFLSWRVGEDPTKITGSELFLRIGEERMRDRIRRGAGVKNLSKAQESEYIKEYGNWIGTGLRFERLRGNINEELAKGKKDGPNIQKAKKILERMVELQPGRVFFKSYKIQKRLEPALEALAARLRYEGVAPVDSPEKGKASRVMMQNISDNLLFLESQMYKLREELLDRGFTFDGNIGRAVTLEDVVALSRELDPDFALPHNEARDIEAMEEFRRLIREDFNEYKDHNGRWEEEPGGHGKEFLSHEEGYYQEFIYNREYNHPFTLWSGDAPVDEFNMAATGPTGGFARRARENHSIGEANALITGLLSDLKYIRTPEDAFSHLTKIYSKISDYDSDKAKEVVAYLSEGLLKFYGSTSLAKIPLIGGLVKTFPRFFHGAFGTLGKVPVIGKPFSEAADYMTGSAAQIILDNPSAPVWHAQEMRYFIQNLLYERGYINRDQMKALANHLTARSWDVWIDIADTLAPLLAIAILIWLLKESIKED